uniref:Cardiolipin synthase 1 n=1 Tax=Sinocyclocheilus grahami TaxID=75366 RepID=A0A672MFS0_SINGR
MFLAACSKSWVSCAKGHTHRLAASTAATCHYSCHDKTPADLPLRNTTSQQQWLQRLKTRCWSSSPLSLSKHHCRLHLPLSSVYAANGFCTEASRKPVLEKKSSEKGEDLAASSPAANEGHFQFKELVSESGVINLLNFDVFFIKQDFVFCHFAFFFAVKDAHLMNKIFDKEFVQFAMINQQITCWAKIVQCELGIKMLNSVLYLFFFCLIFRLQLMKNGGKNRSVAFIILFSVEKPCVFQINTGVQLFLVAASLAAPVFHYTDSVLLQSLWFITALTTAASGYSYYHYGKKTVEVLNNTK